VPAPWSQTKAFMSIQPPPPTGPTSRPTQPQQPTSRPGLRAAPFEFRRDGEAWLVAGHFFDDIGRSGQIGLRQGLAGVTNTTAVPPQAAAVSEQKPAEPEAAPDPARR
jgi:hypothetical protein